MPLITPREIISLAYITNLDPSLIKPEIISTAETRFIKPILTPSFYKEVTANIQEYNFLIVNYIQPCLAFYIKYLIMNQQLLENSRYTKEADPNLSLSLVDISTAVLIPTLHRRDAIREVHAIATQKARDLHEYIITQNYRLYEKPPVRLIAGFLVSSN